MFLNTGLTGFLVLLLVRSQNQATRESLYSKLSLSMSAEDHAEPLRSDQAGDPLKAQQQDASASAALEFARLIGRLKTTPRTGWVRRGVPRYESVADHSWRVAALSLLLASSSPEPIDVARCMQLAVVHDMAESIVGDIPPEDNVSKEDKQRMELQAADTIAKILARIEDSGAFKASYFLNLFQEVELQVSREAKVVKDLDLLDMIIQADEYEEQFGTDLSDFFKGTKPERFQDPFTMRVAEQVHFNRSQRVQAQKGTADTNKPSELSSKDEAFVDEFARASTLEAEDVKKVVRALRAWEAR